MNWFVIGVLSILAIYLASELVTEGFVSPPRADIGLSADGWDEESGYKRDLRYAEAFVDLQGIGVASDFCRAVRRARDPATLRISCALGQRDGMDTLEYNSRTKAEGFRFSRDDYWTIRKRGTNANARSRSDYCRILKDEDTGEWFSGCAIAGRDGFKHQEEIDVAPPAAIKELLEAYEGLMVWFRGRDDDADYAQNAEAASYGTPIFATLLNPEVTRGLQLNRWPAAAQAAGEPAPPIRDYLRWGEAGTLELNQAIPPRQIRAISCWIWWDAFEKDAMILESANSSTAGVKKDRIRLGVAGGEELPPITQTTRPAQEVRPEVIASIGQLTEPADPRLLRPLPASTSATYFFEIWDEEQRIMRLTAPMSAARTGEWQHIVVTATDGAAWWPTWQFWLNGVMVAEKTDGRLSPAMDLKENYIGYAVRGCMQDFRMYNTPMTPKKIHDAIAWGTPKLHPLP